MQPAREQKDAKVLGNFLTFLEAPPLLIGCIW
jgi:hypothetical protein